MSSSYLQKDDCSFSKKKKKSWKHIIKFKKSKAIYNFFQDFEKFTGTEDLLKTT